MKEMTYGWYPSVKDVYRPKGRPASYHLECLFKYGDSLYYQGQVAPPDPELFVRGRASTPSTPSPEERRRKARSVPVPKFTRVPKLHIPTPTQCWANSVPETAWGVVGDSTAQQIGPAHYSGSDVHWPLPRKSQQQQQQQQQQRGQRQQELQQQLQQQQERYFAERHQTPQYAWGLRPHAESPRPPSVTSDAQLSWPVAHKMIPTRPKSSASQQQLQQQQASPTKGTSRPGSVRCSKAVPKPPSARKTTSGRSKRPTRVQSATVRREKTPLPARPVTACSSRQKEPEEAVEAAFQRMSMSEQHLPQDTSRPPSAAPHVPFVYDVNHPEDNPALQEDLQGRGLREEVFEEDDWEEMLNKFGWRAEVHGDPYGLKKFPKRVSYAVECEEPDVAPEPPKVHMETNEPFFYNTIPCRPMTFGVDKEWMSEVLLAKRIELQKREGGVNYNYKNFAFVY